MTAKISPYKVRMTTGVQPGGTITIPYKVGDAQADFDTTQGVNLLLVRRTGGRDERPFMMIDATDTFEVSFEASNIVVTWRENDVSIGDVDDVTFVFNLLSTFSAQASDPLLNALAALVTSANKLIYLTGVDTVDLTDLSAFARTLLDDANAAASRSTLGLGSISTQDANNVAITGGSITGLSSPSASSDAVTKQYVDNLSSGAKWKSSVRAASAVAGTLASDFENGDTIDGIVLATGDRILIKNQAAPADNGIYTVNASGAPSRASDADSWTELVAATVFVEQGTSNTDTAWNCTVNSGGTLGVTSVTWVSFGGTVPSASTTVQGIVEKSTSGENVTGTSDLVFPSVAGVKEMIDTHAAVADGTITLAKLATAAKTEAFLIAASNEVSALTTGTGKVTFRMPYAFTLTAVRGSLTVGQTGGSVLTVDINEAGTTILSTKLTFDNGEKTTTTAATPAVISDTALADDAEITVDIDQIGNGTAKGLKVCLIGYKP